MVNSYSRFEKFYLQKDRIQQALLTWDKDLNLRLEIREKSLFHDITLSLFPYFVDFSIVLTPKLQCWAEYNVGWWYENHVFSDTSVLKALLFLSRFPQIYDCNFQTLIKGLILG